MPTLKRAPRDHVLIRTQTALVKEALSAAGKGRVLSKAEEAKLDRGVLQDAARDLRRAGGKGAQVRFEAWVEAAAQKVAGAIDGVDKPGRGHGHLSLAEARQAAATKGDAGARVARAFEVLTGLKLDAGGAASPEAMAAVKAHVEASGFSLFDGLRGGEPTAWVQDKMEQALTKWGGDSLYTTGKLKLDGHTVYVGTSSAWERGKVTELVGFFDREGRVLGRASFERDDDTFAVSVRSESGAVLASVPAAGAANPPAAWVDALKAKLQQRYDDGEDLGVRIKRSELPAAVRPVFEFAERNVADGVGLERVEHDGKAAYAVHDYSCVSSVAIYSDAGKMLFSFTS